MALTESSVADLWLHAAAMQASAVAAVSGCMQRPSQPALTHLAPIETRQFSVVPYASDAYVATPLTCDTQAATKAIDELQGRPAHVRRAIIGAAQSSPKQSCDLERLASRRRL